MQNLAFRDKEGFVILYDMGADVEINKLCKWVARIAEDATNPHCIVMLLGYSNL